MVKRANRQHALAQIEASLRAGAHIFEKLIEQRNLQITSAAAKVLARPDRSAVTIRCLALRQIRSASIV